MPKYNHNAFMQVIKDIQKGAQVTGLADFKQGEDTYPRVKLCSKHSKKNSARELIKKKIGLIGAHNFIKLQMGLLHHANKALVNRRCKRAAFILDLIEICEESMNGTIGLCDLKPCLEMFAEIGRKQEYNLALQKEQKRSKSSRQGETYKFRRTDGNVNSFLIDSNSDSWYLLRKLEKDKQLGRGGVATVKAIVRVGDKEPHAIKMVKSTRGGDMESFKKAKRAQVELKTEWRIYERLDYRRIMFERPDGQIANMPIGIGGEPTRYSGANGSSTYYFIAPKAKQDMNKLLFLGNDDEQKLKALVEAAQCIKEMHACYMAHHDIKPQNILIMGDGSVRLCDVSFAYEMKSYYGDDMMIPRGSTQAYFYNSSAYPDLPAEHWDIFAFLMILINTFLVDTITKEELEIIFTELDSVSSADILLQQLERLRGRWDAYKVMTANEYLKVYFKRNRHGWVIKPLTMESVIVAMEKAGFRKTDEGSRNKAGGEDVSSDGEHGKGLCSKISTGEGTIPDFSGITAENYKNTFKTRLKATDHVVYEPYRALGYYDRFKYHMHRVYENITYSFSFSAHVNKKTPMQTLEQMAFDKHVKPFSSGCCSCLFSSPTPDEQLEEDAAQEQAAEEGGANEQADETSAGELYQYLDGKGLIYPSR